MQKEWKSQRLTIFYIRQQRKYLQKKIDDTHVSDHHPIKLKLIRTLKRKKVELNQQTRTRWDKLDTPKYESKVNTKISKLKDDSINENYSLTQTIEKTMVPDIQFKFVFSILSLVEHCLAESLSISIVFSIV
jgi:hypothetical protein